MLWSIIGGFLSSKRVCLRPGGDCHAMAAGLKAGGFFTFIDKLDENLCEMCVRDLWPGYTLSFECSSLFIFCWVFWGHKKGTFTSVSAVLGLGVAQDTAFFFRSCCLCLLFPPRATWHCLRFVSGPGEFQCATISYGKFCYSKHDGLPFIPLTHTHTHRRFGKDMSRTLGENCVEHLYKGGLILIGHWSFVLYINLVIKILKNNN